MGKSFALICSLLLLSSSALPQASSTNQKALALTHVTVIDTTGGPAQPDVTVVVRGDRIVGMGKSGKIRVPAGSQIMDAAGKFLIPGLWDMHFHWYHKEYLPLTIANGVTGVRMMLGYADHHEWRKEIEAGQLLGPRMVIASHALDGPKPLYPEPASVSVANVTEARQAVIDAQKSGADVVTILSYLPRDVFFAIAEEARNLGIPLEGHVPVSVTVEEASNAGMKSIEHLTGLAHHTGMLDACSGREADLLNSWQEALADVLASDHPNASDSLGEGPGFHARMQLAADTYSPQKAQELFALLRRNHTWLCPTLTVERKDIFFEDPSFASDPRLKYMSVRTRSGWQDASDSLSKTRSPEDTALLKRVYRKDFEVVGAMRRAGVEFLAGTDAANPYVLPGFSLHEELALLVQAGLTPIEALQTATLNPARFLGTEHEFGTIAPGKVADLVLLEANPLQDISNSSKIAAVVYRGKFFSRASLDAMLAKIEALANRKSIGDLLDATIKEKGIEAAIQQYRDLKSTQPDSYDFGNNYALRYVGRQLLHAKRLKDAIQILELNAEAFPTWWWAFDDLGGAYMDAGEKELAIKSFKKSLQLDPANQHAALKLKQLNSQ